MSFNACTLENLFVASAKKKEYKTKEWRIWNNLYFKSFQTCFHAAIITNTVAQKKNFSILETILKSFYKNRRLLLFCLCHHFTCTNKNPSSGPTKWQKIVCIIGLSQWLSHRFHHQNIWELFSECWKDNWVSEEL